MKEKNPKKALALTLFISSVCFVMTAAFSIADIILNPRTSEFCRFAFRMYPMEKAYAFAKIAVAAYSLPLLALSVGLALCAWSLLFGRKSAAGHKTASVSAVILAAEAIAFCVSYAVYLIAGVFVNLAVKNFSGVAVSFAVSLVLFAFSVMWIAYASSFRRFPMSLVKLASGEDSGEVSAFLCVYPFIVAALLAFLGFDGGTLMMNLASLSACAAMICLGVCAVFYNNGIKRKNKKAKEVYLLDYNKK